MNTPTTTTTDTSYPLPESVRKTCELFRLLAGHELLGLAPNEIAAGLNVAPSWVSKNLPALSSTGFVERVEGTNRWRLGVAFVRISVTVVTNMSAAKRRLEETSQRYQVPL